MKRFLVNAFAALSLLLLVATVGLWVRSYWVSDWLRWWSSDGDIHVSLWANRGSFDITWAKNITDRFDYMDGVPNEGEFPYWAKERHLKWRALGFAYYAVPYLPGHGFIGEPPMPFIESVMPLWSFVVIFGLLPPLRYYFWLKRRRPTPGHCVKCGYDLRASKDRCPECGEPIPAGMTKEPIR